MKTDFSTNSAALRSPSTVNISVPIGVANDLERMNGITKEILGKLGCPGCHSGFDIRFRLERDFRVSPDLKIESFGQRAGF